MSSTLLPKARVPQLANPVVLCRVDGALQHEASCFADGTVDVRQWRRKHHDAWQEDVVGPLQQSMPRHHHRFNLDRDGASRRQRVLVEFHRCGSGLRRHAALAEHHGDEAHDLAGERGGLGAADKVCRPLRPRRPRLAANSPPRTYRSNDSELRALLGELRKHVSAAATCAQTRRRRRRSGKTEGEDKKTITAQGRRQYGKEASRALGLKIREAREACMRERTLGEISTREERG